MSQLVCSVLRCVSITFNINHSVHDDVLRCEQYRIKNQMPSVEILRILHSFALSLYISKRRDETLKAKRSNFAKDPLCVETDARKTIEIVNC